MSVHTFRAAFLALAIFVIWASLVPREEVPTATLWWDKLQHVAAYGAFGFIGFFGFRNWGGRLGILGGTVVLGIALEIAQSFGPVRYFQWGDIAADAIGVLVGTGLGCCTTWLLLQRRADREGIAPRGK